MSEQDPVIIDSPLSRRVTKDGVTVEVSIIRLEHEIVVVVVTATSTSGRSA